MCVRWLRHLRMREDAQTSHFRLAGSGECRKNSTLLLGLILWTRMGSSLAELQLLAHFSLSRQRGARSSSNTTSQCLVPRWDCPDNTKPQKALFYGTATVQLWISVIHISGIFACPLVSSANVFHCVSSGIPSVMPLSWSYVLIDVSVFYICILVWFYLTLWYFITPSF